jgi:Cu/Ag efflux protein CusF
MPRPIALIAALSLFLVASTAQAQMGGGGGGGGGGGRHGGGHGGGQAPSGGSATPTAAPALPRQQPTDEVEIVGVVKDVDPATDRITIAYDEVDALNWPPGAMPFEVASSELMKGVSVGEKVRFKISSQQIWDIKPYVEKPTY